MLVCIFNVGNLPYASPALEVIQHYLNKHSIKFEVITDIKKINHKSAHPSWNKLLVHRMFQNEDFILTWDLDLLPLKNTPNITKILKLDTLNMVYDTSVVLGYKCYKQETFKYNGGLLGIPKKLSPWIESIYDKNAPGKYPSWEQYYLNEQIVYDCVKVNRLPDEWNVLYPKKEDGWDIWNRAILKHFSFGGFQNPPNIVEVITKYKEEYFHE